MSRIARIDIVRPLIVPMARGNQKDSLLSPIMKGMKPRTVDMTVNSIGIILMRKAHR